MSNFFFSELFASPPLDMLILHTLVFRVFTYYSTFILKSIYLVFS